MKKFLKILFFSFISLRASFFGCDNKKRQEFFNGKVIILPYNKFHEAKEYNSLFVAGTYDVRVKDVFLQFLSFVKQSHSESLYSSESINESKNSNNYENCECEPKLNYYKNYTFLDWGGRYSQEHRDKSADFLSKLNIFKDYNLLYGISYGGEIAIKGLLKKLKEEKFLNEEKQKIVLITWGTPFTDKLKQSIKKISNNLKNDFSYFRLVASKEFQANLDKFNRDGKVNDLIEIDFPTIMIFLKYDDLIFEVDHNGYIFTEDGKIIQGARIDISEFPAFIINNKDKIISKIENEKYLKLIIDLNPN